MPAIISATTSSGLVTSADNSGSLQLATNNGTTAVTIDTSQNVGIGTASPGARLHVAGGVDSTIRNTASSGSSWFVGSNSSGYILHNESNTSMLFTTNGTERGRFTAGGDFQFNSGYGSVATAFGCRAWVNFNGTGTVAIRASGNVSSITDNDVGNYTINFTNAMPDTNYAYGGAAIRESVGDAAFSVNPGLNDTKSTTQFQTRVVFSNTRYDVPQVNVFIFR